MPLEPSNDFHTVPKRCLSNISTSHWRGSLEISYFITFISTPRQSCSQQISRQLSLRFRCNVPYFSIYTRSNGKSEQVLTVSVDSEHRCTHSSQSTVTMQQQKQEGHSQQIIHANMQGVGKSWKFIYTQIVNTICVCSGKLEEQDHDVVLIISGHVLRAKYDLFGII